MEAVDVVPAARSIPPRRRVLGTAVGVSAGWTVLALLLGAWARRQERIEAESLWFVLLWLAVVWATHAVLWLCSRFRPRAADLGGRAAAARLRVRSLREGSLPPDLPARVAVTADSCRRLELWAGYFLPFLGGTVWTALWPDPSLWVVLAVWAVGLAETTVSARRSWRFLGLLEEHPGPARAPAGTER